MLQLLQLLLSIVGLNFKTEIKLLKKFILFTLYTLVGLQLYAQLQKPLGDRLYLQETIGVGTHLNAGLSIHFISEKGYSVAVQGVYETKEAHTLPKDYKAGSFGEIFGPPSTTLITGGILLGRVRDTKSKLIRFDLRAGINYGYITRPVKFRPYKSTTPSYGFLKFSSPNYDYDMEKKWFVGIVINPTIDFTFTRFIGLSLGLRANINPQEIPLTVEVGFLIGNLRGKTRKSK